MKIILQTDLIGALLGLLASFSFAVEIIIIRKSTVTGKALDAVMATVWVNALLFLPLAVFLYFQQSFTFTAKSFLAFVGAGISGAFLGRICYFFGTKEVGASRTVPISRASVLVATFLAVTFLSESITAFHLIGIFLVTGGIMLVSYEIESSNSESGLDTKWKILLPVGAMFFYGLSLTIAKVGLSEGIPSTVGLGIRFSVALLALSGYYFWKRNSPLRPFRAPERKLYLAAGIAVSIGFALLYLALKTARVVVVMPFNALAPFFVLILSYFYLKRLEKITKIIILGSALVVGGAILTTIYM